MKYAPWISMNREGTPPNLFYCATTTRLHGWMEALYRSKRERAKT